MGSVKVNQKMEFGNLENEISVWVRNWELKTKQNET